MKKIFSIALVSILSAAFLHAADNFVQGKDIMKIQKPSKAEWPKTLRIFDKDLSAGKADAGSWKIENGELVCAKQGAPITINKNKPNFVLIFEYFAEDDSEGYVFLRNSAIKLRLADKHGKGDKENIGSVIGVMGTNPRMDEPGKRWMRVIVTVEGDIFRMGTTSKVSGDYKDRRLATYSFEEFEAKSGKAAPADGTIGFVCEKGNIKFKNVYLTQF